MKRHLRLLFGLALAAALVALFLRHADLRQVWRETVRADWRLIALAAFDTVLLYVVRAVRWGWLLRPVGRPRFGHLFETTVIGFMASAVLPGRVGEVIRPYLLGRREGFSASAGFATIVFERVLDLLTVLLLLGIYLLVFHSTRPSAAVALRGFVLAAGVVAGFALLGCGVLLALARRPDRTVAVARRLLQWLPQGLAEAMLGLLHSFARGLAILHDPRLLVIAGAYSILLWTVICFGIWLVQRAFGLPMPWNAPLLLVACLTVGVAVPTPGGVGGFHEAYRIGATTFFGVAQEPAIGAAIVLHAISFVPVIVLGAYFSIKEGLGFGQIRAIAEHEVADDGVADPPGGPAASVKGASA